MMQFRPDPHNLHFIFFPAQNAFFNQHFGCRRSVETGFDNGNKFFAVIRDPAARAAQRERRTDDGRQANFSSPSRASSTV